jgi:hypothetical protein
MKKALFLILLALFVTSNSFAGTFVFKLKYKGRKYEKKNAGNEKLRNIVDTYLVFNYDVTTFTFGQDAYIIKYWKEKGRKLQETVKFAGKMEAKLVNKAYRTFMTLNSNTEDKKEFMTLIEPNKMVMKRGITDTVIPFALEGVSVTQITNDIGERVFQSSYVKGKCNQRWTLGLGLTEQGAEGEDAGSFNNESDLLQTRVVEIQNKLTTLGYQNLTPDTFSGGDEDAS